ncbi:MAG: hypothetical protein H6672_11765 [Anaerolineaceae bacterium]|nr:hypothetical protein [Anaerolineaceae bacterium]
MVEIFTSFLALLNETLTAAIVIIAASMLLYNLARNRRDRVARTSAVMLASVTAAAICDVLISLGPGAPSYEAILRAQWIGIAFLPAAIFHLSDALLATTGLPSRGRRRRIVLMLYLLSTAFLLAAAFTDVLIRPVILSPKLVTLVSGPLFPVYVAYFLTASLVSLLNVQRARGRCLTRSTRRRMGYLQIAMLTPAFGNFPYSLLFGLSENSSIAMLVLVNAANVVVILLLLFLAYPLSFFGTRTPDRVVKTELLHFMMRGPATGLLALATIIFVQPATRIFGLPGGSFMPFAVVAVVLLWQWFVALILPVLEKYLIYRSEDDDQVEKLQTLTERLLTRTDLLQLLEAILAASCDYLQVNTAFVAVFNEGRAEMVSAIGPTKPNARWLEEESATLLELINQYSDEFEIQHWHSYWIVPLFSRRRGSDSRLHQVGFLGIQARSAMIDLTPDEMRSFRSLVKHAGQTLDDLGLQTEIYAALEGLLPQITITRTRAAEVEFKPGHGGQRPDESESLAIDLEQMAEQVRAALRHYWGGPGLTQSRLLELNIVNQSLAENDDNPAKSLRAVLLQAIEKQRPDGERKLLSPEWTIYNILYQRFIERNKVRDVAVRLALSEADLYRKQRVAIEMVAETLLEMERAQPDPNMPV